MSELGLRSLTIVSLLFRCVQFVEAHLADLRALGPACRCVTPPGLRPTKCLSNSNMFTGYKHAQGSLERSSQGRVYRTRLIFLPSFCYLDLSPRRTLVTFLLMLWDYALVDAKAMDACLRLYDGTAPAPAAVIERTVDRTGTTTGLTAAPMRGRPPKAPSSSVLSAAAAGGGNGGAALSGSGLNNPSQ